ncbi:MAG: M20/M25/M40 family metallo-hydrolase, partial [Planctomycetales bacterium]|nr:M20/M25/M40 family metallo-hydrolase [Planctomycetales bacterium]
NVVVAHKGVVRWRCRTIGRAVHSSSPENGDNAIYRMGRVVAALERYHREELRGREPHRLLGTPSLSVGLISGGASVNVVPDACVIEIDRRVLPGEDCQAAYRHVVDYVYQQLGEDAAGGNVVHEPPYHASGGLSDENNGQLAARLGECARRCGGAGQLIGVPFGTDASHICAAGVPTVVFGPGSIAQAHTADEWIALDQLHAASEILFDFASGW